MNGRILGLLLLLCSLCPAARAQSGSIGKLEVITTEDGAVQFNIYDIRISGMRKRKVHFGMWISQAGVQLEDSWVEVPPERITYDPVYWEDLAFWFQYPLEFLVGSGDPDQPFFGSFFVVDTAASRAILRRDIEFSLAAEETDLGMTAKPEEGRISTVFSWAYGGRRWRESFSITTGDFTLSVTERDSFQPLYGRSDYDYKEGYIILWDTDLETFYNDLYGFLYRKNRHRLQEVREKFLRLREHYNLDYQELAELIINWVQYTTYELPEKKYGIYTQLESLESASGDCDTRSVLLYTILKDLGYEVAILYSEFYEHAMLGIARIGYGKYLSYRGDKYFFVETTATGWEIGDLPPEWSDTSYWSVLILDNR